MTPSLLAAEHEGPTALAAALEVATPNTWPPELYDSDDLRRLGNLLANPVNTGWALYYLVECATHELVGLAGYAGAPAADGVVELGYSILPPYRRRGFATEAVSTLVEHAFSHPSVRCVAAETFSDLLPSIGVLVKSGFRAVEPRRAHGPLRYELRREMSDT